MKFYLLLIGLLITFCSYGEMPSFDWELLNSDVDLKEKYNHILDVDSKAAEMFSLEAGQDNPYTKFYGIVIDRGRDTEKMRLLKTILENFEEKDPHAKVILGLIYFHERGYILEDALKRTEENMSPSDVNKIIKAQLEWTNSQPHGFALVLFSQACGQGAFLGCFMDYFMTFGKVMDCKQFGDESDPNCDEAFLKLAVSEKRLLTVSLDTYDSLKNEDMKQRLALLIYATYKQGLFPLHPEMQNVKRYGFPRDSQKAEVWKQRAEKIIKQEELEGL